MGAESQLQAIWGSGWEGGGVAPARSRALAASRVGDTKHGMMKFREDRSLLGLGLPSGGFHDRYFILNSSCLRLYKEVRVSVPTGSFPGMGSCTLPVFRIPLVRKWRIFIMGCWDDTAAGEARGLPCALWPH